jgi:Protein of unknown function (DUF1585)/Protein of unknown function (DUF1549)
MVARGRTLTGEKVPTLQRGLRRAPLLALFFSVVFVSLLALDDAESANPPPAGRTLDDYRHFRVTAIDLLGRMPTREEIAAFERSDFDFDRWVDEHLSGPGYGERLTRLYMDVLRLEPNSSLVYSSAPSELVRHDVLGPDGAPMPIYYRANQRRERPETDQEFCFSPDETGVVVRRGTPDVGTPKKLTQKLLDQFTVRVKPWWLYHDYQAKDPTERYNEGWKEVDPQYKPVESLLTVDGKPDGTPIEDVRVCREEAGLLATGHVYASGRTKNPPDGTSPAPPGRGRNLDGTSPALPGRGRNLDDTKLPGGRARPPPLDRPYATQHAGQEVACDSKLAFDYAPDCGCGVGLERCLPGDRNDGGAAAFYFPNHMPLGAGNPLDDARQPAQRWFPYWWSREAVRFLDDLFENDRDFREILVSKRTFVNGPLAQFYRTIQRSNCCGSEASLGMLEENEPLFDPRNVPPDLQPQDVSTWRVVDNRGPHAAGILTMPMFLEKYASARARAAAVYNDFLCKSFIAENQQLTPSTEPNLTIRPGCKTCHATLEPLAAYFSRIEPSNFVFLPEAQFPVHNPACKRDKNGRLNGPCAALYDPAFSDAKQATLRGAYASPEHADETPLGAGRDIVALPEFAQCAVQRVTSSFLGRPTTAGDEDLLRALTDQFVRSGYRMRALVRAIVRSDEYGRSNNLASEVWRGSEGPHR